MARIRVLVVDDSALFRRLVSDALARDPAIEVVGTASNGHIALARVPQLNPDVVTLDVEMPVLDGLATLAELRKTHPRLPVIMFSSLTERAAAATVQALLLGATDCVAKPSGPGGLERISEDLLPKVKAAGLKVLGTAASAALPVAPRSATAAPRPRGLQVQPELVAIGVSTGGPNALADVFRALPGELGCPVVVVQHMPPLFTRILAERLDSISGLKVREGIEGARLMPGEAWVAPGDFHMRVVREGTAATLHLEQTPPENACRPAVDVLFRSVAESYGAAVLGLVMTGMGQDGLRGAECIRDRGGSVWAQDEASSVIWGMPGHVVRAGLADRVLPLDRIGAEIVRRVATPTVRATGGTP